MIYLEALRTDTLDCVIDTSCWFNHKGRESLAKCARFEPGLCVNGNRCADGFRCSDHREKASRVSAAAAAAAAAAVAAAASQKA